MCGFNFNTVVVLLNNLTANLGTIFGLQAMLQIDHEGSLAVKIPSSLDLEYFLLHTKINRS